MEPPRRHDGDAASEERLVDHARAFTDRFRVPSAPVSRRIERAHRVAEYAALHLPLWVFWIANHWVCRAMLPKLRDSIRCSTIYGFDLVVRSNNGGNYYRCGFYEHGTMHAIERCLRPGDVFVDAGASVGQMSFLASRCVGPSGQVLAFEPTPERCEDLEAGIALNGMTNVRAYPFGLDEVSAEKLLYVERGSPSMFDQSRTTGTLRVTVKRLDDVLDHARITKVRMLKIDVEGFEPNVLLGAARLLASAEPPIICYEHGIYASDRSVTEILRELGGGRYRFFQPSKSIPWPAPLVPVDPRRLRNDNVFAIPVSLIDSLPPDFVR